MSLMPSFGGKIGTKPPSQQTKISCFKCNKLVIPVVYGGFERCPHCNHIIKAVFKKR